MKRERLPKYVSSFLDNRGKRRYRFRKTSCGSRYFEAHPGTAAGKAEYAIFLANEHPGAKPRTAMIPGSVDALLASYYGSTDFRGQAQDHVIEKRRAVLEAFRSKNGHRLVAGAPYHKLDKYIAEIAVATVNEKGRKHGGPFAAETARKLIRSLFRYATKLGWRTDNPMDHVGYRPKKSKGYHSWSEPEIGQYRDHWPLGTKQRLALELMLWTGKRRSDAVGMGPQHIEAGQLVGRDKKTDKAWIIPIAPQLQQAIDAMETAHLCFIPSDRGRAYSAASFGNMFRQWCNAAGLPHCTAHGLRKAISRRMAELDVNNAGIKSITLHSRDEEVAIYTRAAEQKKLAKSAIAKLSRWELSSKVSSGKPTAIGKAQK